MNDPTPTPEPNDPTATAEPSAAGAAKPGETAAGAAPPGDAGPEPPPEEPVGKEERVRQARHRGQESPRAILLEFFNSAFQDEETLRTFCFKLVWFPERFKDTDRFPFIVRRLIGHCECYGRIADLWGELAYENKAQYDEWFPRWSVAERKYRNERESKYAEFRDASSPRRTDSGPTPAEHPLSSGNPGSVSDWFFTELGPADRGTVLATALFEGMNRTYLVGVAQDFAKLFDPAADRTAVEGGSQS